MGVNIDINQQRLNVQQPIFRNFRYLNKERWLFFIFESIFLFFYLFKFLEQSECMTIYWFANFGNEKTSEIWLVYKFINNGNLENSKNFRNFIQFRKLSNLHYIQIREITKFINNGNFTILEICKIPKISEILLFRKSSNFHYIQIREIIKFLKSFSFEN